MKSTNKYFFSILFLAIFFLSSYAENRTIISGSWKILLSNNGNTLEIRKDNEVLISNLQAEYMLSGKVVNIDNYIIKKVIKENFNGTDVISIFYRYRHHPDVIRRFFINPNNNYIETDFTIKSKDIIASNYMAPVVINDVNFIKSNPSNRALFVPFDNDKWIRYKSHKLEFENLRSYEVSAVFDNLSRKGLIIGSVEHDIWKTAIEMSATNNSVNFLKCYGGVADDFTRDSLPHGQVRGSQIKSPRIFIGYFNDWRMGLETFADVNASIAPSRSWNKAVPFGWNSWGVLQFNLNYQKAIEVSDFIKNNLQDHNFINSDNLLYIGLDSGWNSFSKEQLKAFVEKCKNNGQEAGIYWTPFTDWGKNPERIVPDVPNYRYKELYLYANGKPQELDGAYAIDPTHPAVEEQIKKISNLFRSCGFSYVKLDFMTHGSLEADHWYNPAITTGIQAYNYGMKLINKYFNDIYINLSISPIFPSQYAHSRRIACDAWNKIKDTEYTLNALSYGWWIDRVYKFNDPDHVVLQQATDGENRARITSAVITGLYIVGDDFSEQGSEEGKVKARKFLTNPDVNAVACGISFQPVEGDGENCENQFFRIDKEGIIYYVVFNYSERPLILEIPFERIGIRAEEIKLAKELWTGELINLNSSITVGPKDVKLLKFEK